MRSVLLHVCCGPCATYVASDLQKSGLEVTAYWYNPNVHPFREHRRRLEAMRQLAEATGLPLVVENGYDMIDYFRRVVGHESERCRDCYTMRLSKAAETAGTKQFDAFTTTLLISPYQDHELIRRIGEEAGREQQVEFHYRDFRPGFRESHRVSREMGLYHQAYCGCVYSEWERYGKAKV